MMKKIQPASSGAEHLAAMMLGGMPSTNVAREMPLEQLRSAPEEWNFFRPLPEGKLVELMQSIEENGLLVPLIAWAREDGYMLLSGHNRKRALELLGRGSAPCIVYESGALDEDGARAILVDCNWVQRTLSSAEKAQAVYTKYVSLGRLRRGSGQRAYDVVAEHFGLKATQVYQYTRLAQLEPHWLDMLDAGSMSIKAAVHLTRLTAEQRDFLHKNRIWETRQLFSINKDMPLEEIREILQRNADMRDFHARIPAKEYDAFSEMVLDWLRQRGY